ncbi:MAG: hypothetical protein KDA96_13320 [Planctomycetaceae bacterium]|nr:hypothetical protein [Planctomycetaceae bacterium]
MPLLIGGIPPNGITSKELLSPAASAAASFGFQHTQTTTHAHMTRRPRRYTHPDTPIPASDKPPALNAGSEALALRGHRQIRTPPSVPIAVPLNGCNHPQLACSTEGRSMVHHTACVEDFDPMDLPDLLVPGETNEPEKRNNQT